MSSYLERYGGGHYTSDWIARSYASQSYGYPRPSSSRSYDSPSFLGGGARRPNFKPNSYKPTRMESKPLVLDNVTGKLGFNLLTDVNRKTHHADQYGGGSLVVRRGAPFEMGLNVQHNVRLREVTMTFSTGSFPQENKDTVQKLTLKVGDSKQGQATSLGGWQGQLVDTRQDGVRVQITPSAGAVVGKYTVQVSAKIKTENDNDDVISSTCDKSVYILFNAWCKDDDVHLNNDKEREEYVMNESGRVYRGTTYGGRPKGEPWNFGQFSKHCLECAVYLLEKSEIAKHLHGNPVMVVRALSAMVNSNDDNGLLLGRWDGNYRDGTSPTEWVGSTGIIEQYMKYKRPVKYGQCWVFSALCVTVCRALGIPCRSVTNYDSAHDTDGSLTIDRHFDPVGNSLSGSDDSVWNFHVWNEAWMQRDDLPDGYGGWQAFDATPQETSEGTFQCGPAPVRAIKEGDVFLNYDARFIFAEVNGDRLVWICDQSTGTMHPVRTELETAGVGSTISTKAVGSDERNDVTREYKYKEGSPEERRSVQKATRFACAEKKQALKANIYSASEDVKFDTQTSNDGGDLQLEVTFKNKCDEVRTGFIRINATASYYTGIAAETLDSRKYDFTLEPGEEKVGKWELPASKYLNDIDEDADVKVTVVGHVKETQQYFVREKNFEVEKEEISVQVANSRPRVGQDFNVTVTFKNPIKVALTNGVFRIEGSGIQKDYIHRLSHAIGPLESYSHTFTLTPKYPGSREIVVSFKSRQVVGFTGSAKVQVQ